MRSHRTSAALLPRIALAIVLLVAAAQAQEGPGSVRGTVSDRDFGVPLAAARVKLVELEQQVLTSDEGAFVFGLVPPGRYTLVFEKDGYEREVQGDVVVVAGQLADVDVGLSGTFTELEEFVVQDLQLEAGSEASLLNLRFESAALLDSIGADLLSRAGASDAAAALTLVSGASVQDGKFAVIRGLPDRYVSSQLNGVRLPSADEETRAVELDQFPAAVIESIQVSKTFTPDQQGDASGGAVDVRLTGIPEETILEVKSQVSYNTNVTGEDDFISYEDGGISTWGNDADDREIQPVNQPWTGAVGVSEEDAPTDYKLSATAGGKHRVDSGLALGGLASFFYERDSSFYDDGVENDLVVDEPGMPMVPQLRGSGPQGGDFTTSLNDVTRAEQSVQWGGLGSLGLETENHSIGLSYLYTRTTSDTATLSIDTRGKEFFFPGYDRDDPTTPGHGEPDAAPYIRQETLEYTERTLSSLQLGGHSRLPVEILGGGDLFKFQRPELDWTISTNKALQDQPDKRQFGALWKPARQDIIPPSWFAFKPSSNINLGNLQRIFEKIEEDGDQVSASLRLPFDQWSGDPGYFQLGVFEDRVDREFRQETFSNPGEPTGGENLDFEEPWSSIFPDQGHPLQESLFDINYDGKAQISAWYGMVDVPLTSQLNLIGGARVESTEIEIVNDPEELASWFPPGSGAPNLLDEPGEADVDFDQDDLLPSIGLVYQPHRKLTLRGAYGETVARQTFRELSAVIQQEFLGGPIFIGNPDLQMSAIENWDLRADYTPYEGGLVSLSWFYKDIEDPIEFVQVLAPTNFTFTTPTNYPEGRLSGIEVELRQDLTRLWDDLEGFGAGVNATFIDSVVQIPDTEALLFEPWDPMSSRDATNAPEHLYNLYLTYDHPPTGTQSALFYTVRGDTLVAGAYADPSEFVPNVYEKEYGTLNFSLSRRITDHIKVEFKAKNLTNPEIEEVYRSGTLEDDVTKSSYTKGIEFSIGLSITN